MSTKRLAVNLNKTERMIINDICQLTGVADRSLVIKELAMTKANEWLKQLAAKRMEQREALLAQENKVDNGSTNGNMEEAQDSADVDSNASSIDENPVDTAQTST